MNINMRYLPLISWCYDTWENGFANENIDIAEDLEALSALGYQVPENLSSIKDRLFVLLNLDDFCDFGNDEEFMVILRNKKNFLLGSIALATSSLAFFIFGSCGVGVALATGAAYFGYCSFVFLGRNARWELREIVYDILKIKALSNKLYKCLVTNVDLPNKDLLERVRNYIESELEKINTQMVSKGKVLRVTYDENGDDDGWVGDGIDELWDLGVLFGKKEGSPLIFDRMVECKWRIGQINCYIKAVETA